MTWHHKEYDPLISVKYKKYGMGGVTSKNMIMLFHWNLTNKVACHQRIWPYNFIKTLHLRYRRHGIKMLHSINIGKSGTLIKLKY